MHLVLFRTIIVIIPVLYILLIWFQSSHFNPSRLELVSVILSPSVILIMGILFELAHLIQIGLLFLFLIFALLTFGELSIKKEIFAATVAVLYGIIDEIHQFYVPFRSFAMDDILKNTIGVFVLWFVVRRCYHNRCSTFGFTLRKVASFSRNKEKI
ncbi:VanZ family protein [Alkalihalobacillus sp. BA299]|uniref:VanZ family protein n=1 Tax=Alkalihalobacillus sp. BA299 TaxID=2815938 RepID=UPI001ADC53FB|nr:VanZ family protein [Alkalihalobacillus sp. BA299]